MAPGLASKIHAVGPYFNREPRTCVCRYFELKLELRTVLKFVQSPCIAHLPSSHLQLLAPPTRLLLSSRIAEIMKFNYSGLVLLLSAAAVRASPVYSNTLIETLILHGFTSYATGLQSNPELLALLENRNDITIWAPINSAITSSSWVPRQSKGIYRRQSASSYSSTISHSPPSPNTGSIPKREASNTPSNFLRLYTFLNDPEYVNLGEDQPLRHVSNFAAPLPGQSVSRISVRSGGGNTVSQVSGPFKYDGGIIYGVSGYIPLSRYL